MTVLRVATLWRNCRNLALLTTMSCGCTCAQSRNKRHQNRVSKVLSCAHSVAGRRNLFLCMLCPRSETSAIPELHYLRVVTHFRRLDFALRTLSTDG